MRQADAYKGEAGPSTYRAGKPMEGTMLEFAKTVWELTLSMIKVALLMFVVLSMVNACETGKMETAHMHHVMYNSQGEL